jgi:hypothetical protein
MLKLALDDGFNLILATNCRLLEKEDFFIRFSEITGQYKEHIELITSKDRFHLKFFDPADIIRRLRNENYKVVVSDWSDRSILLSEYDRENKELNDLDTRYSCCNNTWIDYLGVLPEGGWQICPPYSDPFGDIFSTGFEEIRQFRNGLTLRYKEGCTRCMVDLVNIHQEFESRRPQTSLMRND